MPRILPVLIVLAAFLSAPAAAKVKFTRVDQDDFIVFHKKSSMLGGTKKAVDRLYQEISSLCVAAGFSHYEIKELDITQRQYWKSQQAGSNAQVRFHREADTAGEFRDCQSLADPKTIDEAKKALASEQSGA